MTSKRPEATKVVKWFVPADKREGDAAVRDMILRLQNGKKTPARHLNHLFSIRQRLTAEDGASYVHLTRKQWGNLVACVKLWREGK